MGRQSFPHQLSHRNHLIRLSRSGFLVVDHRIAVHGQEFLPKEYLIAVWYLDLLKLTVQVSKSLGLFLFRIFACILVGLVLDIVCDLVDWEEHHI